MSDITIPLQESPLLREAKKHYEDLLNLFKLGEIAANALFDVSSEKSGQMRALLLGLESASVAAYSELW